MKILAPFFALIVGLVFNAFASDAELYDPAPPADSAFVRVLNADSSLTNAKVTIGSSNFGELQYPALSPYHIVKAGDHDTQNGKSAEKITIKAGNYYTIAFSNTGEIMTIQDELLSNPAKARVYLYNFTDGEKASIVAVEHGAALLENIAKASGDSREVNALKLKLSAQVDGTEIQTFDNAQLKRRTGLSFALFGTKGAYKALMLENEVTR